MQTESFDQSGQMIDTDLFGLNPNGIVGLLEPDGWYALNVMGRRQRKSYERLCPISLTLAQGLHASVKERRRWGKQLWPGGWTTFTAGEPIGTFTTKIGRVVQPPAESLHEMDLVRHVTAMTCSVAATDQPQVKFDPEGRMRWRQRMCTSLRIDADMDEWWELEDHESVFEELRSQRRVVEAAGLRFEVFRTGGRGVQIVIPLPCSLEPAVASLLSRGIRRALRLRPNLGPVAVDKDSFDGLLRLPGGCHARGATSLWIDVDRGRLHDPGEQVRLTQGCLAGGPEWEGSLTAESLLVAQDEILAEGSHGLNDFFVADERDIDRITQSLPKNSVSMAIMVAHRTAGAAFGKHARPRHRHERLVMEDRPLSQCDRAWAESVWSAGVQPGAFWHWLNMGGSRGMLAAVVLYGEQGAVQALHDHVERWRAAGPKQQAERHRLVDHLWKSFDLKDFIPRSRRLAEPFVEIDGETADLAEEVTLRLKEALPSSKWSVTRVAGILAEVFAAIAGSGGEGVRLSFEDISLKVNKRHGGGFANASRVRDALLLVCADSVIGPEDMSVGAPVVHALQRVPGIRREGEGCLYLPGPALYGSHVHRAFCGELQIREET